MLASPLVVYVRREKTESEQVVEERFITSPNLSWKEREQNSHLHPFVDSLSGEGVRGR